MTNRKADFAGAWYPGSADECEREINRFLSEKIKAPAIENPVGGIVPHAGWFFSGSIACHVIHSLKKGVLPDLFVIFGMHLHPSSPSYIMEDGAWETPFGEIQIEKSVAKELISRFSFNIETPDNYTQDNTIELQLPFIKYFFENANVLPIGVPPEQDSLKIGKAVVEIASRLGLKINILGSTDLTHYGPNYGFTPKGAGKAAHEWMRNENDRKVIDAMIALKPEEVIAEALSSQNACCAGAAATAIAAAKELGAKQAQELVYATSYDKNPSNSFVGYTGILF
ncbi:MAG: AmmeMemoRadiSam system protein B [Deltaproteobacteria bacterium]|nr:AmmeMemoRadiSam system protein B [Deltaproteobacteria bacterium]